MNVRIGVAITTAGLTAHAVALAYIAKLPLQGVVTPVVAVLGPILLVSIGALVGTRGGSPKGRWSRTFVAPFLIGSVVLVSALGPAKITQARAQLGPGNIAGVGQEASSRAQLVLVAAREEGPSAALDVLRNQIDEEPELILLSHHLAHETGRISIEQADFDLRLIDECTFEFASGCFHGMLERYFFAHPPISPDELSTFCLDLTGDSTVDAHSLECAHGLGHGLAVQWNHDPVPAVEDCDLLHHRSSVVSVTTVFSWRLPPIPSVGDTRGLANTPIWIWRWDKMRTCRQATRTRTIRSTHAEWWRPRIGHPAGPTSTC